MKRKLKNSFEITLDFKKDTENPSRLFKAFADFIDGINNLDLVIAKSINSSVSAKVYLDDVEKGSIIGKLYNLLVINEEEKLENVDDNNDNNLSDFIIESRNKSLKFLEDKRNSVEDLEVLSNEINKIAKEKQIDKEFNYGEISILDLANSLNTITDSTSTLEDGERFILSDDISYNVLDRNDEKISIEKVEELLTEEEITTDLTQFYKIKKPDFLGDSQWEFKHGNKSLKVKILHNEWLEKFHNGEVIVMPGDSLKVKIRQILKYNKNGYLISEKIEIIEVINIIRNK